MSDKFLPDISVGNFAVDILKSMAKDPNGLKPALKESTIQAANAPDVSKIQVSDDFVSLVTEGKKPTKKTTQPIRESTENRLNSLVERLSSLIVEAKSVIQEMSAGTTTTGSMGVNLAGRRKPDLKRALKRFSLRYRDD